MAISTYLGNTEKYKKYYGKNHYEQVVNNIINVASENIRLGSPVLITLHLRVDLPKTKWEQNKDFLRIIELVGKKNISWLETYENWSVKLMLMIFLKDVLCQKL